MHFRQLQVWGQLQERSYLQFLQASYSNIQHTLDDLRLFHSYFSSKIINHVFLQAVTGLTARQ